MPPTEWHANDLCNIYAIFGKEKLKARPIPVERQHRNSQQQQQQKKAHMKQNVVALFKTSNSEIDLLFKFRNDMWILTEFPINHYIGSDAMQRINNKIPMKITWVCDTHDYFNENRMPKC